MCRKIEASILRLLFRWDSSVYRCKCIKLMCVVCVKGHVHHQSDGRVRVEGQPPGHVWRGQSSTLYDLIQVWWLELFCFIQSWFASGMEREFRNWSKHVSARSRMHVLSFVIIILVLGFFFCFYICIYYASFCKRIVP